MTIKLTQKDYQPTQTVHPKKKEKEFLDNKICLACNSYPRIRHLQGRQLRSERFVCRPPSVSLVRLSFVAAKCVQLLQNLQNLRTYGKDGGRGGDGNRSKLGHRPGHPEKVSRRKKRRGKPTIQSQKLPGGPT